MLRVARLLAVLTIAGSAVAGAAPKKNKGGDVLWIHPDFAAFQVSSIALLPAAAYDNNLKSEKTVEAQFSQALKPAGYRWISPLVAKDMLRASMGDSALAALDRDILEHGRVDSLAAGRLCRALRVTALVSARVDLFEQIQVEWNQSGKPSTTVHVHAALVDSAGRLLWSASGSETAEGPYHDVSAPTMGVRSSGLTTEPVTAQGGAPSFEEVSTRLFTRWAQHFPTYRPAVSPVPAQAPK